MFYSKDGAEDWDGFTDLRPFKAEMEKLIELLPTYNGFHMFGKEEVDEIDSVVASDASGIGFGLVRVHCGEARLHKPHEGPCSTFIAKRLFSLEERKASSALREILALRDAYDRGSIKGENVTILHCTDSAAVEAVMRIGSPVPALQREAIAIHEACWKRKINLRVEWRPRKDERMVEADLASRMFDVDDFGCGPKDFQTILDWAGFSFEFDLFASATNSKCENFAVRYAEVNRRDHVNAFTLNWNILGEVFICPPPGLVVPILRQLVSQGAVGVLLIPFWRSSHFWPVLAPKGRHFAKIVTRFMSFSPRLSVGKDVLSDTFRKRQAFLVLRVNGTLASPWSESLSRLNCVNRGCEFCEIPNE
jgi:hypothetical protein